MTTVLELAQHAGVSTETVLRVILREPVNENARRRVGEAIAALGMPDYPRPDGHIEVLPAEAESVAVEPAGTDAVVDEVRGLFREIIEGVRRERRERIDDVALTTDLIVDGWRNVDRRLGRLEKMVERLDRREYFGNEGASENDAGNGASVRRLHLP